MRKHARRSGIRTALLGLLWLAASPLAAQEDEDVTPPRANPGPIRFWSVADLSYDPTQPALLGARVADPAEFPASFYSASVLGRCTSTLVGPRVLLTAAHCVGNGQAATIRHRGESYVSVCTHAPEYPANLTADWALCAFDRAIPGVAYESVNLDGRLFGVKSQLLLTGFGCTNRDGTGGNDGTYRIGEAPVRRLPRGRNHDIVTEGTVAVCFGDSGGPAFVYLDTQRRKRVQVSVNSRGNIRNRSHLSSLSSQAAIDFLTRWSSDNGVQICGLHSGTAGCRPAN